MSPQGEAADAVTAARVEQGILLTGGVAHATLNINNPGTENRRKSTLLEALDFPSRGYRENTVENAHGHTCEWLLQNKQYQAWVASRDWNRPKHRLLWIKGKPGSGKSTIMKFAVKNSRGTMEPKPSRKGGIDIVGSTITFFGGILGGQQREEQQPEKPRDLVISHFFNSRAKEQLDKSAEGMYRTLLVQILKRIPEHQEIFARLHEDWIPSKGLSWPTPKLEELLNTAVENLDGRPIAFYVDALDECDKHDIRQMVQVFANIIKKAASSQQIVRVCFASRPYPDQKIRSAVYLDLSLVEEHQRDIRAYVDAHLQIGSDSAARKARRRLSRMAQGAFLWVKLVVDKLNDEYSSGRPDLYARWLNSAYGELQLLYKDMIERGMAKADKQGDGNNKQETVVCFLVILFTARDFSPRKLVYTIEEALGEEKEDGPQKWRSMDDGTIKRYISTVSHGLLEYAAETSSDANTVVQFIHETANSFMSSEHVLPGLLGLESMDEVGVYGYEMLQSLGHRVLGRVLRDQSQLASFFDWEVWHEKLGRALDMDSSDTSQKSLQKSVLQALLDEYSEPNSTLKEHPILWFVRSGMLWFAEMSQRFKTTEQDEVLWLSRLYEMHGHDLMNRVWRVYNRFTIDDDYLVDYMVMQNLSILIRQSWTLVVRDARRARQRGLAPGIWYGTGPRRRWTYMGLHIPGHDDEGGRSTARCIVELYLEQLEATDRPALVQELLQQLADTWSLEKGVPSFWDDDSAISLADVSEKLGLFFLIALIPAERYDDSIVEVVMESAGAGFAEMIVVFLERGIPTDFLLLDDPVISPSYLNWAEDHDYSALAAILRSRGIEPRSEDSERGSQARGAPVLSWESAEWSDTSSESSAVSRSTACSSDGSDR